MGQKFPQRLQSLRGDINKEPISDIEVLAASCIVNEMMIQHLANKIAQLEGKKCRENAHTEECVYTSSMVGYIWCKSL